MKNSDIKLSDNMDGNIRKLASIQKIDKLTPIEGADRIELAKIQGWQVIVKKNEFKEGELCIYCEIDSVLPERPEFEFLRGKHFRIKTMKMKGKISQGIVFPLYILGDKTKNINVGEEVTEYLGITKYEPPVSPQLLGMAKGNFPTHIVPKTDEERLQSAMSLLDEMKGRLCYITQKEDGTSYTAYHVVESDESSDVMSLVQRVGVCSRNLELKNEAFIGSDMNIYWKVTAQYDIENKLKQFYQDTGRNIAIQGEIVGDGIQKNRLGFPRNVHQLHLFNIFDIDQQKYLDYEEFIVVASELGLPTVKTIFFGRFNFTLEELLKMAEGKYPNTNNEVEGIVIRPTEETLSDTLQGRMSFKVINNLYLLKED